MVLMVSANEIAKAKNNGYDMTILISNTGCSVVIKKISLVWLLKSHEVEWDCGRYYILSLRLFSLVSISFASLSITLSHS